MRRLPLALLLSLATWYRADDGVASPSPVPAAAEQEPHLKFVSCDEMVAAGGEAWRELCVRGGCQPRADGGCRKRSASGDCSTFKGCVQGEFAGMQGWTPVTTPPVVPPEVEFIRSAVDNIDGHQRYVNMVAPESGGQKWLHEALRVNVHVEIFLSQPSLEDLLTGEGMSGSLGQKLSAGSLVELAEELELVVSVNGVPLLSFPEGVGELTSAEMKASDDTVVKAQQRAKTSSPDFVPEVVGVVGSGAESQGGIMTGRLLEDLTVEELGPTGFGSVIVEVQLDVSGARLQESGVGEGQHTLDVHISGNGYQHAPAHAWFSVLPEEVTDQHAAVTDGAQGDLNWHRAQIGAIMNRMLVLQEENAYLKKRLDSFEKRLDASVSWHTREMKHLVFELGANDGAWVRDFCHRHPFFEPHIFEPQPRYAPALAAIAREFKGRHNQKAVWTKDGQTLEFHAHSDEGGVGSSLFGGHAYGQCGSKVCDKDFSETYHVSTVDFVKYMREVARPHDVIVLRMDIEGAEYAVTRHMVTQGVACWVDYWEFEGHAMYTPDTAKYRPVDAVLPWLLRGCPGQPVQMVLQDWYTEDYKVWSAWNETDNKECPLPMIVD